MATTVNYDAEQEARIAVPVRQIVALAGDAENEEMKAATILTVVGGIIAQVVVDHAVSLYGPWWTKRRASTARRPAAARGTEEG